MVISQPNFSDIEKLLEKGAYEKCISLLEPSLNKNIKDNQVQITIRLYLLTAYVGLGENEKAKKLCKGLSKIKDPVQRETFSQYLSILNAPDLPRPREWSITIPLVKEFNDNKSNIKNKHKNFSEKKIMDLSNPPTGDTKALSKGFLLLIISINIFLLFLLN